MEYTYFASAAKGLAELLADELTALGARNTKCSAAGVFFDADPANVYRILWWSRLAGRVLMPIIRLESQEPDDVYQAVRRFPWEDKLSSHATFIVDAVISKGVRGHGHYFALRVKDGIVDRFRDRVGHRPAIDKIDPDLRLHLAMRRDGAVVSLDLGGGSLHRRGYRAKAGKAPLKENLAAALLMRAGWPEIAQQGGSLVDPLCGSGTLLIEGAMMAWDLAPGLYRKQSPPRVWRDFDADLWAETERDAKHRAQRSAGERLPLIKGYDRDRHALRLAREAANAFDLGTRISFEQCALNDWQSVPLANMQPGLVITNPPYGQRLGNMAQAAALHAQLGAFLREQAKGWQAAVFTGDAALGKHMGIRAHKIYKLHNGNIPCSLLLFHVTEDQLIKAVRHGQETTPLDNVTEQARMFANRLKKMAKQRRSWAKREGLECYRIYDADLPDYNLAVDRYKDVIIVAEYQAPSEIPTEKAHRRLQEAMLVIPEILDVSPDKVILKVRKRQRGQDQYQSFDQSQQLQSVREYHLKFLINPHDYLDTGLFNDHRLTRRMLGQAAKDKDVLNLFAYTGTASVYAAAGGAKSTLAVDMSTTYTEWARKNMAHNNLSAPQHRFVKADVLQWLPQCRERFDLIFCDPPTFSNSKTMARIFQVEQDQTWLFAQCAKRLRPHGELWFSTNFSDFQLDEKTLEKLELHWEDLTAASMPKDFERTPTLHRLWRIRKVGDSR